MATREGDFASLLDDLFDKVQPASVTPVQASAIDALNVADELYSGRIKVSATVAENIYREAREALGEGVRPAEPDVEEAGPDDKVDQEAIAAELGLRRAFWQSKLKPDDFDRIRRNFAMQNHPDRVAPHLRQRALVRMQIANMLIDEAKRGKR
ncbi:hypothetical protein [Limoniibacter endophyticus]|uniref:J domain-containing protein n=1 Tax=Limoniibacter endophyticus TaxID=1565040 RepID=A0A8J3GG16_9HYPH|nr:hypothetical protein [Limoniibacter endophyticus]GHC61859.1 hypothetical protein GCM10010136_02710 [Limoniibacter endophyticus]